MGARRSREASARLELGRRQARRGASGGDGWSWGNTYREGILRLFDLAMEGGSGRIEEGAVRFKHK